MATYPIHTIARGVCISLGLMALGCGPVEKMMRPAKKSREFSSFKRGEAALQTMFQPQDFVPSSVKKLTKSKMIDELNDVDELWEARSASASDSSATEGESPEDKCLQDLVNQPIVANGDTIAVYVSIDISRCPISSNNSSQVSLSVTGDMYLYARCEGRDWSRYNGKTLESLGDALVSDCPILESLRQIKLNMSLTITGNGLTLKSNGKSFTSHSTKSMAPCKRRAEGTLIAVDDTCVYQYRLTNDSVVQHAGTEERHYSENFTSVQGSGLKSNPKSQKGDLFPSGINSVTINDWSGKVEYKGSTKGAPYSLSNGKEKAEGTLSHQFFAHLSQAEAHKVPVDIVHLIHSWRRSLSLGH